MYGEWRSIEYPRLSAKRLELSGKNCGHSGEVSMLRARTITLLFGIIAAAITWPEAELFAQAPADPNGAPSPYRLDANWLKMPDGRKMGQVTGVDIGPDGKSVWVFERCGAETVSTLRLILSTDSMPREILYWALARASSTTPMASMSIARAMCGRLTMLAAMARAIRSSSSVLRARYC